MKYAVAPEGGNEKSARYRGVMEGRGLKVSETRSRQATLDGSYVEYYAVSGYRQGEYRVTVRVQPTESVQIVAEAADEEQASRLARRLRDLGFSVDVDGERVRASSRKPTVSLVSRAIDVLEDERGGRRRH